MAAFNYEAVDAKGKALTGQISASSSRDALRVLAERGLVPISIDAARHEKASVNLVRRQTAAIQDLILTLKQLALLLNAGVPLISAVETLQNQGLHLELKQAFEKIGKDLRSGQPFSLALSKALPKLPGYVFQLTEAGEATGDLGPALSDAAGQMEYEERIRQDIRNALTYPSILVISGLTAVLFIFVVVVPRFSSMLANSEDALPWISKVVLGTGMFVSENTSLIFVTILALAAMTVWAIKNAHIRHAVHQRLAKLPLFGDWLTESDLARWASMLGTMLTHGVDLIRALELARATLSIDLLQTKMEQATKLVRAGRPLSGAMNDQNTFSDTAISLIQVGEESGELPSMLGSLATLYTESGRQRMKRFLLLLEPAAIILIGLVIGGIVAAIMLAITSVNQVAI